MKLPLGEEVTPTRGGMEHVRHSALQAKQGVEDRDLGLHFGPVDHRRDGDHRDACTQLSALHAQDVIEEVDNERLAVELSNDDGRARGVHVVCTGAAYLAADSFSEAASHLE